MNQITIPSKLVGQEFKHHNCQFSNRVIEENEDEQISNDFFEKSNEYIGEDCLGRKMDLSSIIGRPDGYLQGKLSDNSDVDYYKFSTLWYKGLNMVDKYNVDITVTLDHIPAGCDYDLILYDENGNQVGIGKDNGNGGKSVSVPNWNMNNKEYTVKVQAKDGSPVNEEEYYHLSFQTQPASKDNGAYKQMQETKAYMLSFRKKLYEGKDATEEMQALEEIRGRYDAYYAECMKNLHNDQAKEYIQNDTYSTEDKVKQLLDKMSAGESITTQEKDFITIFATAQEYDSAMAISKLNSSIKENLFSQLEELGIDVSDESFEINITASGQATVSGIEDEAIKAIVEDIITNDFSYKMLDVYTSASAEMYKCSNEERELRKAGIEVERFLYKATKGEISLKDITVENGKIKGVPENLDKLLNRPGENQMLMEYRADILAIKNYERIQNKNILAEFSPEFMISGGNIQLKNRF